MTIQQEVDITARIKGLNARILQMESEIIEIGKLLDNSPYDIDLGRQETIQSSFLSCYKDEMAFLESLLN